MMNLQQYVQYMKDGAAANGQDTSLAKIFTTKQQYAIDNNISTDWQRAVLARRSAAELPGRAHRLERRHALLALRQLLRPERPDSRARAIRAARRSRRSTTRRIACISGVSANASRITTDQGEGGGAYGYALAMTPLGRPTNYTNPDSAGLLDPRPDDDQLNINPVLESAVGRSPAEQSIACSVPRTPSYS